MEKKERNWLYFLIALFVIVNIVTFSTAIPWQRWLLWNDPIPDQTVNVQFENYQITMPSTPVEVKADQFIRFTATSADVTYGFGVFRDDNSLVFQMQVIPGRENEITWKFDEPGSYSVRSTEYSGPQHSKMYYPDTILVTR